MKIRLIGALIAGMLVWLWPMSAGAQTGPPVHYWGDAGAEYLVASPTTAAIRGTVVQVATSNSTWYARKANGTVWAWGNGAHGELGNGTTTSTLTPTKVTFPAGVTIAYLADTSPFDTALAVDTTGQAWGWGFNSFGQLCRGNTKEQNAPVKIPLPGPVTSIAGAGDHALYDVGGTVYACGSNGHGDLGNGNTLPSYTPVAAVGLSGATSVYAAWRNSGALVGGDYYAWGYNALGTVGDGTTADVLSPEAISLPGAVTELSLGGSGPLDGQTLALSTNGSLYAWGGDAYGQLGDGGDGSVLAPESVTTPAPYVSVESGGLTSYGIDANGNLWAWGDNRYDEIGNGTSNPEPQLTPVIVDSGVSRVSATNHTVEDLG